MNHAYMWSSSDSIDPNTVMYGRIIFDNVFNIIIIILVMQMLAGIIIDKFGDLREQED
jgi:hypothetical protein